MFILSETEPWKIAIQNITGLRLNDYLGVFRYKIIVVFFTGMKHCFGLGRITQSVISNVPATQTWRAKFDPQCQHGIQAQ